MEEILLELTQKGGVILGGVQRFILGYTPNYTKTFIDVAISQENKDKLKEMGRYMELPDGTTFPYPIEEQFVVKLTNGWVLDIFVRDVSQMETKMIDGIRVQSEADDLSFHQELYNKIGNDYCKEKLEKRKQIYGL